MKKQLIRAAKSKKPTTKALGFEADIFIFCDEHLTPETSSIIFRAKELERECALAYIWTADCQIYEKKTLEGHPHKITNTEKLNWSQSQADFECEQMEVTTETNQGNEMESPNDQNVQLDARGQTKMKNGPEEPSDQYEPSGSKEKAPAAEVQYFQIEPQKASVDVKE